ncbi:hypothetical protein JZ751_000554 [Albula glossodonta]|uniref:Uncharacterized protein n=1 Tax=Albula glossodonta TaxID=121402 RepID=A0A8T2PWX7_9TELE|nr:hypothetical protein JZ751_000554 [Albula glossodonta]
MAERSQRVTASTAKQFMPMFSHYDATRELLSRHGGPVRRHGGEGRGPGSDRAMARWRGEAAGVVNQAAAVQGSATSQHQGRAPAPLTSPHLSPTRWGHPLHCGPPPKPSAAPSLSRLSPGHTRVSFPHP